VILTAGQQANVVHTEIPDIADEQAVVERGAAAVQEVERRTSDLRAVVAEDAVAEHRGVEHLAEVLYRHTGAARAGAIAGHLDALDGRIGARIDLDAAAIEIEERRLGHVIRFDWRVLAGAGSVVVRARDTKAAQHGLRRYAVAEIDDVIDDRREAWRLFIGDCRIGGGQHHLTHRFQRDAVVPPVEPDQRLAVLRGTIGPGMDVDDLVGRILSGRVERRLDAASGLDVVRVRRRVERHRIGCIAALGEAARRRHSGRSRHPEERTSAHDQLETITMVRWVASGGLPYFDRLVLGTDTNRCNVPAAGRTLEISLRRRDSDEEPSPYPLEIGASRGSREGDHVADVLHTGEVHKHALKSHAESGVLDTTEFA